MITFGEDFVGGLLDRCEIGQVACHEGSRAVRSNRLNALYCRLRIFVVATGKKDVARVMFG